MSDYTALRTTLMLDELRKAKTRIDAANIYADGLRIQGEIEWPRINAYLIERWSRSGLAYIKKEAWG